MAQLVQLHDKRLTCEFHCSDVLEKLRDMEDESVELVIGSPPYHGKMRRYGGTGKQTKMTHKEWANWMAAVVEESVRVSRGFVIIIANGCVQAGVYKPSVERLMVNCEDRGLVVERPVIWHKNAPPTVRRWFSNDWEYVTAFRRPDAEWKWNWEAIADPPKYSAGGKFRQRNAKGKRVEGSEYPTNPLARPRDVLRVTVGGGHLGSKLSHLNEAPFPEKLVEPFILGLTDRGDTVLDPFMGSGTTAVTALRVGRNAMGIDNRQEQGDLMFRRIAEELSEEKST